MNHRRKRLDSGEISKGNISLKENLNLDDLRTFDQ